MTCSLTLTIDLEGDERKEGKREEGRKKERGKWPWPLLPLSVGYNSLSYPNVILRILVTLYNAHVFVMFKLSAEHLNILPPHTLKK